MEGAVPKSQIFNKQKNIFPPNMRCCYEYKMHWTGYWHTAYILKARILTPTIPQKKLNFPQICPKMPQNGPKMAKNDPKWPKVAQIWPKMAQNGPRMTQNDPKWPKNDPKWPKITSNGPKMTPAFTHFFRNFFTEKAVPQTFFLLECMRDWQKIGNDASHRVSW